MEKKQLKRNLALLALPIAAQNLVAFFANAIDTVMIGQLSETAFSATSIANQVFFIITLILSGIAGGSNVLISQYWGRKDKESIYKVLALTYRAALVFVGIVTLIALFFPVQILSLFTTDTALIQLGSEYLQFVAISYLFFCISTVTVQILRSVHAVKISMIASLIALGFNALLNYMLIFGNFGMPALGVKGAAIATTIARLIELMVVVIYVYFIDKKLEIRLYKLKSVDKDMLKLFIQKCGPVTSNEAAWSIGESCVVMIIGRMGANEVMAIGLYNVIAQLSNVLMNGLDSAACVLVGNTLGARKIDDLQDLRKYFQRLSKLIGLIDGLLMLLAIPVVLQVYPMNPTTQSMVKIILMMGAVIEVFKSIQCMNMMGILRGGGDVKFACMNDILFLWFFSLPLGFIFANWLHLPFPFVFIAIKSDQIIKCFTSELRIRSNKWMKTV